MKWIIQFLTSSIGRKLIMSLTGLFLILFLTVHLIGNLTLLTGDGGQAFNEYSAFMGHNPLIQAVSIGNFFFIILHTIQGLLLAFANKKAKGSKYAVTPKNNTSWASKNMALLGSLVLAFILMHLGHFWYKFKFYGPDGLARVSYDGGEPMIDAYTSVVTILTDPIWLAAYLIGLAVLAFHLNHGFASAFQSLGIRHKKYTPIINGLGKLYSILIPLGFAIIPMYLFFTQQ
ncbi:MAG: succinate dehydrogenase / fumarate reductase cytochrome b subunit [Saprospiraceae bacterium]|jgi:succinate dehydrogenase / fumarate reductase cytochrome b subunit